jgi:uncharacterized membrane protein
MVSPTPAPTSSDDLSVDSSANIEGILLTVLIVVVLFMIGAALIWGGMVRGLSCHCLQHSH